MSYALKKARRLPCAHIQKDQHTVAKKRTTTRSPREVRRESADAESDQLRSAASAVAQAREALDLAQTAYEQACNDDRQAVSTRQLSIGDIFDGTLEFVRRHPATGLFAAGVVGYLFGRALRR